MSEVFNHCLKSGQEILIKVGEILFFFDVSLNKRKNILPQRLHWFNTSISTSLLHISTDTLRIVFVNFDKISEDYTQMTQILLTNTNCHLLIYLDDVDQLLDCIWLIQEVHVLTSLVKDVLPIRVSEAEEVANIHLLTL